jgi:uncharacterized membrane protein
MKKIESKESKKNKNKAEKKVEEKIPINQHVIDDIVEDKIEDRLGLLVQSIHAGPLPSPNDFKGYEEVLPGAADRILKIAEEITLSESKVIQKKVEQEGNERLLGLKLAFTLAFVVLLLAFYAIYAGKDLAGLGIILAELTSLCIAFIYKQNKEKESKKEE